MFIGLFYALPCDPSWGVFHVQLRRVCILLFMGGVFCRCVSLISLYHESYYKHLLNRLTKLFN